MIYLSVWGRRPRVCGRLISCIVAVSGSSAAHACDLVRPTSSECPHARIRSAEDRRIHELANYAQTTGPTACVGWNMLLN